VPSPSRGAYAGEISLTRQTVYLTDQLYEELNSWGDRYYRDRLTVNDLPDPHLPEENGPLWMR